MKIELIDKNTISNFYSLAKENGSIFNSEKWLRLHGTNLMLFGIFDNSDKIIGGFYLYKQKHFIFNHYKNPPFTPHNGLFFIDNTKNKVKSLSNTKKIISLINEITDKFSLHITSFAFPHNFSNFHSFILNGYKVIPNYTYLINLKLSEEEMLQNMSPERRNDINRATKDNIDCKLESNFENVKKLVLNTFNRKNAGIDIEYLDKILFQFAENSNSFAFVSYKDSIPSAAAFCVYDKNTAYYLFGGYDSKNKHHGAGVLAIWNSIKHSKELNLNTFDFEGSMIPEVEKYFRDFGGDSTPYFFVNKASLPLEFALKLIKRERF